MYITESANSGEKVKQPNLSNHFRISCLSLLTVLSVLGIVKDAFANTLLKKGATGSDVSKIQARLRKLGYLNEKPSGFFGEITEKAVKQFQQAKGLDADGVVGVKTRALLFETVPAVSYNPTPSPSRLPATPVRLRVPALPPSSQVQNAVAVSSQSSSQANVNVAVKTTKSYLFSAQVFRRGDCGQGIKMLQEELKQRGFYSGTVDGIYGAGTENAVKQLQANYNLPPDGIVGAQTLALLRR